LLNSLFFSDYFGKFLQCLFYILRFRPSGLGHIWPATPASPDDGNNPLDDIARMVAINQALEFGWTITLFLLNTND
jgi:hypothetical protein